MNRLNRAGTALAAAVMLLSAPAARPAGMTLAIDPDPAWRQARDIGGLVAVLDRWLDRTGPYPRRAAAVTLRLIGRAEAAGMAGYACRESLTTRALYDPATSTVYLIRPWSRSRTGDVAILLHELVHHRQQAARHWYCPGAMEPDAYRLQAAWLAERGQSARINRIAVALEAGCTARDIHPD